VQDTTNRPCRTVARLPAGRGSGTPKQAAETLGLTLLLSAQGLCAFALIVTIVQARRPCQSPQDKCSLPVRSTTTRREIDGQRTQDAVVRAQPVRQARARLHKRLDRSGGKVLCCLRRTMSPDNRKKLFSSRRILAERTEQNIWGYVAVQVRPGVPARTAGRFAFRPPRAEGGLFLLSRPVCDRRDVGRRCLMEERDCRFVRTRTD